METAVSYFSNWLDSQSRIGWSGRAGAGLILLLVIIALFEQRIQDVSRQGRAAFNVMTQIFVFFVAVSDKDVGLFRIDFLFFDVHPDMKSGVSRNFRFFLESEEDGGETTAAGIPGMNLEGKTLAVIDRLEILDLGRLVEIREVISRIQTEMIFVMFQIADVVDIIPERVGAVGIQRQQIVAHIDSAELDRVPPSSNVRSPITASQMFKAGLMSVASSNTQRSRSSL